MSEKSFYSFKFVSHKCKIVKYNVTVNTKTVALDLIRFVLCNSSFKLILYFLLFCLPFNFIELIVKKIKQNACIVMANFPILYVYQSI